MTSNGEAGVSGAAVAGLAREVEALRRTVEALDGLPGRVEELAGLVAKLGEHVAAASRPSGGDDPRAVSWLDFPETAGLASRLLQDLTCWMRAVYLRYADARRELPVCWLWHPDIVEELVWLNAAWRNAYVNEDTATAERAGDWHDRYRPGVVRRVKDLARGCSLDRHQAGEDTAPPATTLVVPLADAATVIAEWWANDREGPAPQPSGEHLRAADALRRGERR